MAEHSTETALLLVASVPVIVASEVHCCYLTSALRLIWLITRHCSIVFLSLLVSEAQLLTAPLHIYVGVCIQNCTYSADRCWLCNSTIRICHEPGCRPSQYLVNGEADQSGIHNRLLPASNDWKNLEVPYWHCYEVPCQCVGPLNHWLRKLDSRESAE